MFQAVYFGSLMFMMTFLVSKSPDKAVMLQLKCVFPGVFGEAPHLRRDRHLPR